MKRPGEAKQTAIICGVCLRVGGSSGAAVRLMHAELGKRKVVSGGSLGQLGANDGKQQRLHDQRIDSGRANQPSPKTRSRPRLI